MTSIEQMESYPVMLTIRGEQYFDDVDPDETELMTEGTMTLRGENIYLTYQESELTGMEGTTTTFEVVGNRVTLKRSGSVNSQMVFEEGQQHVSLYETPYGTMTIDICTSKLEKAMDECPVIVTSDGKNATAAEYADGIMALI